MENHNHRESMHLLGGTADGYSPAKVSPKAVDGGRTYLTKENKMLRFKITDYTS